MKEPINDVSNGHIWRIIQEKRQFFEFFRLDLAAVDSLWGPTCMRTKAFAIRRESPSGRKKSDGDFLFRAGHYAIPQYILVLSAPGARCDQYQVARCPIQANNLRTVIVEYSLAHIN